MGVPGYRELPPCNRDGLEADHVGIGQKSTPPRGSFQGFVSRLGHPVTFLGGEPTTTGTDDQFSGHGKSRIQNSAFINSYPPVMLFHPGKYKTGCSTFGLGQLDKGVLYLSGPHTRPNRPSLELSL